MTNIDFGKMIVRLRKEKGMTQKQLAEMLNVSDKAVSRWENGKNYPDIETMMLLAEVLEVSVNDLLRGKRSGFVIRKKHIVRTIIILAAIGVMAVTSFWLMNREGRDYSQAWKIVTEEEVLNMSDDKLNALLEQKERIAVCSSEDNYRELYEKFGEPYELTEMETGQNRLGIVIELVNHEDIYLSEIIGIQVLAKNQNPVPYEEEWLKDIMRFDSRALDFIPWEKTLGGKIMYIVFYNASDTGFVQRAGMGIMSASATRKNIRDDGSVMDDIFIDLQIFCDNDFSMKSMDAEITTHKYEKCRIMDASDANNVINQDWIDFSKFSSVGNLSGMYINSWEVKPEKEERSGAYRMNNYVGIKKENGIKESYHFAWKLTDAVFKNEGKKYNMENDTGIILEIKQ